MHALCAGVSVAELAAREGVTQRRMRAVVKELLARRMPQPPAEYLALQIARLNEALAAVAIEFETTALEAPVAALRRYSPARRSTRRCASCVRPSKKRSFAARALKQPR